ncbi:hypothetical protein [Mycolicibacterium sp. CH28]|uniref:hypothetical protein n=1 Tax=Mycolicibacterium sp. CH28 TaxID=2512237 RepID=UPI00138670D1|nr:hypothetical protein [Mycolicibacterium sp. CH28]
MTEPTSDEEDHADYTDDHQDMRRAERQRSAAEGSDDIHDIAPDVAAVPNLEPPD